jgi:hypothetical protein
MPNTARGGGISRKITNVVDRKKLKEIAHELEVPKGAGLIIRTAGAKRTKTEIKRDCEYLQRMWHPKNAGGGGAVGQKRKQLPQKTRFSSLRLMKIKFLEWKRSIYLLRWKYPVMGQNRRGRNRLMLMTQPLRAMIL